MEVELTLDQISTIKTSLKYSLERINDYPHSDYETKKLSRKPLEDVMSALPDLRIVKEKK